MGRLRIVALGCAALLLGSCGSENAVLDVEMTFDANPLEDPVWVRVLVGRADSELPTNALVPEPHRLTSAPSVYQFSIEDESPACDASVSGACDLLVEVRYCLDPDCASLIMGRTDVFAVDPQAAVRYRLDRPLFAGQRTRWKPRVDMPRCTDEPSTCTSVTAPSDPESCSVDERAAYPTHVCTLLNCDAIDCDANPGGSAGFCLDGTTGPHLCE